MDSVRLNFDLELRFDAGFLGPPTRALLCGFVGYRRRLSGAEGAGFRARTGTTRECDGPYQQQWNDVARIHVLKTSSSGTKAMGTIGRPHGSFDWQLINRAVNSQREAWRPKFRYNSDLNVCAYPSARVRYRRLEKNFTS